jgi:PTS system galactitol-specific IIA component
VDTQQLRFRELVAEDLVLVDLDARDRTDALTRMATLLVERGYCDQSFVDAILERERVHPSALPMPGHKIAIPHTDATHVNNSAILFARLRNPVEFRSMGDPEERLSVSMISMFALKEKKRIGDLLETLITVYQDESVLEAIFDAPDARAIFEILKANVERLEKA